jgi:uncharacterized membrane protein YkvA (DUF1232 family)
MGKDTQTETGFFDVLQRWLQSLPYELKIPLDMMGDEELKLEARTLAVGTTFYLLSPIDLIPEKLPGIGYIDDAIILHMSLFAITEIDPARSQHYRSKYPGTYELLDRETAVLKETLGALYSWLVALVRNLRERDYKGREPSDVIDSAEVQDEIFDAAMEYAAGIDTDPKVIERALMAAPPERIVGLLSSGLEEDQKRQLESEEPGLIQSLSGASQSLLRRLGAGKVAGAEDSTDLAEVE